MEKAELINIIQKSKDGDMEAMEKLLLYAHTSVSYQCRKMLKNEQDAEDMTQEILVTVYQKLDSLKEPAAFNQWLKKITATRCINVLTRTHVELQFAEDEEGNSILNTIEEMDEKKIPDKWLDNKETTRMIEEIVNGLPDVQRLCTLMFYYSEMSVKEIANALKVSENTIKSRLNYARKAIKERVLDYEKKGVKLYGLSPLPFLFYFLHKRKDDEKDPVAAQIMVDEILAQSAFAVAGIVNVAASASTGAASTAAVGTAAATGATGAAGAAATTGVSSAGIAAVIGAIPTKIVAGVAAALVLVGGTTAAVTLGSIVNREETAPTVLVEEQDDSSRDDDIISEKPESTSETQDAAEETTPETEETIPEETKAENNVASNSNQSDTGDSTSSDDENTSQTEPTETTDPTEPSEEETAPSEPTEEELRVHTHTYFAEYTVPPNCREEGYTLYRCATCTGETYKADSTEILPHNYVKTVVPPTAYSQGYTLYECTAFVMEGVRCHSYTTDYTEKLPEDSDTSGCAHSFVEKNSNEIDFYHSTTLEFICEYCGFSYTEFIPSVDHQHEWELRLTAPPTCNQDGFDEYVCYECGIGGINPVEKRENIVPALGHDFTTEIVAPTETAPGYTLFTCNRCECTFKDNYTEQNDGALSMHTHSYTSEGTSSCGNCEPIKYTCACGHFYFQELSIPHSMESRVVEPTSTAPGYTEYWCTVCGYSFKRSPTDLQEDGSVVAHVHNYAIPFEIAATCEENGRTGRECICGERFFDETDIPSLGHNLEVTIPPMCEENTGLRSCTRCDYTEVVEGKPHNYIATVVEPTETEAGYIEYTCSRCRDTYRTPYTATTTAQTHTHEYIVSYVKAPCCCYQPRENYTCYECVICGNTKYSDIVDQFPHNYSETTIVEPTVYSQGYTIYRCTNICEGDHSENGQCEAYYIADYTNKLPADMDTMSCEHDFTREITLNSTCNIEGILTYSCNSCGFSYTEILPATEHNWQQTAGYVAGCEHDGQESGYSCTICNTFQNGAVIPALGHDYTTTVVSPTVTSMGYTEFTCNRCGISFKDHYTEMSDSGVSSSHAHNYSCEVIEPVCGTSYKVYSCECGHTYEAEHVEIPHNWEMIVIPPTETVQGYTYEVCSTCGVSTSPHSYTDPIAVMSISEEMHSDSHSHSYTSTVTSSTCTTGGYTACQCSCGDSYITNEIGATGHSYTFTVVDPTETEQGYTEYICSVCGDSYRDNYTDFPLTE